MLGITEIYKNWILPLGDALIGQSVMKWYSYFEETQWMTKESLIHLQNERLCTLIKVAYSEIPFYRELYDKHGVDINKINTVEEIKRLPVVTKDLLREAFPERCVRKGRGKVHDFFTSGSSGRPFAVRLDSDTLSESRALMLLRANYSGWCIGDAIFQTGVSPDRGFVKKAKDRLLRVEYRSAFDLSDEVLDKHLDVIEKGAIRYLMGYPGSMFLLAKRAHNNMFKAKIDGIVTWGDNLYAHYRRQIEQQFKCRITDTYGCGEGIQIAAQCGCQEGCYHIFMPHVVVEITKEGVPVPDGEIGDILLTRLNPGVMPLIRYHIGDIGKKSSRTSCSCGRGLEILESVDGRDTDIILTPNGNRLIVHFFTGIFEYYPFIDNFQVIQNKIGEITVNIVPMKNFSRNDLEKIELEIKDKGDKDLRINFNIVNDIQVEASKKRRFVISKIMKNQTK
jgi:phenylacetate-CoA ligase